MVSVDLVLIGEVFCFDLIRSDLDRAVFFCFVLVFLKLTIMKARETLVINIFTCYCKKSWFCDST